MTNMFVPAWWSDKFKDLPIIQARASKMTDDDIAFQSDLMYMRDLLHDIWECCYHRGARLTSMPTYLFDELDAAIAELKAVRRG